MESTDMVSDEREDSAGLQQLLERMTPSETSPLNSLMNGVDDAAACQGGGGVLRSTIYL